jgi:hypothetical protein
VFVLVLNVVTVDVVVLYTVLVFLFVENVVVVLVLVLNTVVVDFEVATTVLVVVDVLKTVLVLVLVFCICSFTCTYCGCSTCRCIKHCCGTV